MKLLIDACFMLVYCIGLLFDPVDGGNVETKRQLPFTDFTTLLFQINFCLSSLWSQRIKGVLVFIIIIIRQSDGICYYDCQTKQSIFLVILRTIKDDVVISEGIYPRTRSVQYDAWRRKVEYLRTTRQPPFILVMLSDSMEWRHKSYILTVYFCNEFYI
jgi:hypothetical protein